MAIEAVTKAISLFGSQAKLAKQISLSQAAVSKWKLGESLPTGKNARAIEIATGGRVTRGELRPDIFN